MYAIFRTSSPMRFAIVCLPIEDIGGLGKRQLAPRVEIVLEWVEGGSHKYFLFILSSFFAFEKGEAV